MSKAEYKRIVVKVGTSTLTRASGRIDLAYIAALIDQIAHVRLQGIEVILVSSGAITAGLERLGLATERPNDMPTLQAAAAIGQVEMARQYAYCATNKDIVTGQVLLTRSDTSDRTSYLNARNTLLRLLELGTLPIVNENDTVAIDEIRFGDNDTLAATVATLVGADLVILLSDIEGLYTADPRKDEDAKLLNRVGSFTEEIVSAAGGVGSKTGSGGMATKVEAARVLMRAGIPMVICEGHKPHAIEDIIAGNGVGTLFSNDAGVSTVHAKKLWIALGDKAHGAIIVDDGARRALREKGSSLLPVGVKDLVGDFRRGVVVNIRDSEKNLIGRGITGYSSDDIRACMGKRSCDIQQDASLTHMPRPEIINRDEMVVF